MGNNFSEVRNQWFCEKVEELGGKGITQAEIARRLEVMPQYLTPILNKKRNASEKLVLKLCETFDISQNDLVKNLRQYEAFGVDITQTIQEEIKTYKPASNDESIPLIPVDAMAGYGRGDVQIMEHDVIDRYVVPEFKARGVEFFIRVSGPSMYPTYSNGDLLACKRVTDVSFFQWGKVYVLDTNQGPIVKRLYQSQILPLALECRSDNSKDYPPFDILKTSIRNVAIVLGCIRLE